MLPLQKKRKRVQAFAAPKDKNTKAMYVHAENIESVADLIPHSLKRNATSSPLLTLPLELRRKIWGYVLGNQLIHIGLEEQYVHYLRRRIGRIESGSRLFNIVCQSTMTEREVYELSRSLKSDQIGAASEAKEDILPCGDRHAVCLKAFVDGYDIDHDLRPKGLNVNVLTVCRQVYVDANPVLWSTNTWSFHSSTSWRLWVKNRNAIQKPLLKKVHLFPAVVFNSLPKAILSGFKGLDELNLDIFDWQISSYDIESFFSKSAIVQLPANSITVISNDCFSLAGDEDVPRDERTTIEDRAIIAEKYRTQLVTAQAKAARHKQEKVNGKLLKGRQNDTAGTRNIESETRES